VQNYHFCGNIHRFRNFFSFFQAKRVTIFRTFATNPIQHEKNIISRSNGFDDGHKLQQSGTRTTDYE
jgi:hypothetical protein